MTITKTFDTTEEKIQPVLWRSRKILLTAGGFLLVLILVEIWISHTLAGVGEKFNAMESLQREIIYQNQLLESQIANESSLAKVASESAYLGLKRPKVIQYIR